MALVGLLLVAMTVAATRGAGVLALALLISASFQGLYGLLILVSGHDKIWHVEKLHYLGSATGTFVNRNHFAGFLAMGLAVGMGLILSGLKQTRREDRRRSWVVEIVGDGSRSLVLGLLLVIGLAGLLASFSRAGTALGLAGVVGTLFVAGRGRRVSRRLVPALLILAVAAVPLMQIGADRLLDRFAQSAEDFASTGSRAQVWGDTLAMAADFPVVGTGFGTFSAIYPVYRSQEVRHFWAHAHNDLLQAGAEGGLLGIVLLLLVVVPIVIVAVRALTGAKGTLGIGFAAGLLAVLLHGLIDFNFHIPANAAIASILAGTLLGLPWVDRSSSS